MILQKQQKLQSKRHILFQLAQQNNLKNIHSEIMNKELNTLSQLFENYNPKNFNPIIQSYFINDPILKGKKFINELNLCASTNLQQTILFTLFTLADKKICFPQLINFLIIKNNSISINYCQELNKKLPQELQNLRSNKIELLNEKYLILNHLNLILITIQQDQKQLQLYDSQIVKNLNQQIILLLKQNQDPILNNISKCLTKINDFQQSKENLQDFIQYIFHILLSMLLQQHVLIPELLKYLTISNDNQTIYFRPTINIIKVICQKSELKNQVNLLKIDLKNLQYSQFSEFKQKIEQYFPNIANQSFDQIIEQYLVALELLSEKCQQKLIQVYEIITFRNMMNTITQICGEQIQFILELKTDLNDNLSQEEFEEYGTNLLKFGTRLTKLQKKINQQKNIIEIIDNPDDDNSNQFENFFKVFLNLINQQQLSFPLLFKYLNIKKERITLNITIQDFIELKQNQTFHRFSELIIDCQLQPESQINDSENFIEQIEQQIDVLYKNKVLIKKSFNDLQIDKKHFENFLQAKNLNTKSKKQLANLYMYFYLQVLI